MAATPEIANPVLRCCFQCKCNMVHHRHTNVCPFRFCSLCGMVYCFRSMEMCALCGWFSEANDWYNVRSWTETVDRRSGRVVHSTHAQQLALQGLIHCILTTCLFPCASGGLAAFAGVCWLFSSPGHFCGDGLMPREEGDDRFLSASDFSDMLNNKPLCKPCTDCYYRPPKTDTSIADL